MELRGFRVSSCHSSTIHLLDHIGSINTTTASKVESLEVIPIPEPMVRILRSLAPLYICNSSSRQRQASHARHSWLGNSRVDENRLLDFGCLSDRPVLVEPPGLSDSIYLEGFSHRYGPAFPPLRHF